MERGLEFLKSQVSNAVMQHRTFLDNLVAHEQHAEDDRYRALCSRFVPRVAAHQQMLEDYQQEIGADRIGAKRVLGKALGVARDLADAARESDFLRLAGDIVESDQSQDTFRTFRDAGHELGLQRLAQIGEHGERDHEEYHREAIRLCAQLFVEHVRAGDTTGLNVGARAAATSGEAPPFGHGPGI